VVWHHRNRLQSIQLLRVVDEPILSLFREVERRSPFASTLSVHVRIVLKACPLTSYDSRLNCG
jgi:hypothetical protein